MVGVLYPYIAQVKAGFFRSSLLGVWGQATFAVALGLGHGAAWGIAASSAASLALPTPCQCVTPHTATSVLRYYEGPWEAKLSPVYNHLN